MCGFKLLACKYRPIYGHNFTPSKKQERDDDQRHICKCRLGYNTQEIISKSIWGSAQVKLNSNDSLTNNTINTLQAISSHGTDSLVLSTC